jgi:hypothetical protein
MPDHEYDEQELGPAIADALHTKADANPHLRARGLADEARRRVRRRRQNLMAAAAAVVAVVAIGGGWNVLSGPSPSPTSASDSSAAGSGTNQSDGKQILPESAGACPAQHPIETGTLAPPTGTGLDLNQPVRGLQACRYRLDPAGPKLLGSGSFDAAKAQQIVDAIKALPERNPDLPVFRCVPEQARPHEAIVLRFNTAQGIREVWVVYDGCADAGFFTGTHTYGLYPAPLKLFMTGALRPAGGTYLDHLRGW